MDDLNLWYKISIQNVKKSGKKKSGDISAQLKKLHDLYKDGVITGYEYERAKKKILD